MTATLRLAIPVSSFLAMDPDRLRTQLRHLPFRPFTVELSSGKLVHIQHPDYAMLSSGGGTLVVFYRAEEADDERDDDRMEIIDVPLITNLSVEGGSKAAA